MKKMKRWLTDMFSAEEFNDMDTAAIESALNDQQVRAIWLGSCLYEIKRINIEVDHRLLHGPEYGLTDLCARRKAYQDVLEAVLGARRQAATQTARPNLTTEVLVNLDRVTA